MNVDDIKKFKTWIEESKNIVFFGGAGTSTESDIPDFRSAGGVFDKRESKYPYPPEKMVSHSFLEHDPKMFFEYYKENLIFPEAVPNNAHKALAKMEADGNLLGIITQNIDGLHQMAGSKNVAELHGSVHRNYCIRCGYTYNLSEFLSLTGDVPTCPKCRQMVRPEVTLYEESLDSDVIHKAVEWISSADMLIIGGTSLVVYPAAGFIHYFKGDKLVVINRDATSMDNKADILFREPIGEVLYECVLKG